MKTISLPPAALGAAVLLHLALVPLRLAPPMPVRNAVEPIEIRFAAAEPLPKVRRPEPPAAAPAPPPPPREVPPVRATAPERPATPPPVKPPVAEPLTAPPAIAATEKAPPAPVAPPPTPPVPKVQELSLPPAPVAVPAPVSASRAEPAPAAPAAPVAVSRLGDFLDIVHRAVEEHKEYPSFARQLGQQGRVVIRARILADGRLGDVSVLHSSGHPSLDKAALAALRRATPLRAPADFGLDAVTVEIPVVFRLI